MSLTGLVITGVIAFVVNVVANWFPKPAKLTAWGVTGVALVLILVMAMFRIGDDTSSEGAQQQEKGAAQTPSGHPTSPGATTTATSPRSPEVLQPAASFGCDSTSNTVAVAVHPAGSVVACVNGSTTKVWNIEERTPLETKDLGVGAEAVAFNPAGSMLLRAGSSCWQLFEGNRPWNEIGSSTCGLEAQASSVAYAPDGKRFATRRWPDGNGVRFWDVQSHKAMNTYQTGSGKGIAYSPAGRYFATGSADAHPYVWDLDNNGQRVQLTDDRRGHSEAVIAVAFNTDGTRLVSGSQDQTAKIWSIPDGTLLTSLTGEHQHYVRAVAFSPDGRTVVTGGEDRRVVVWDVATGTPIRKLEGSDGQINSLSFDRDGKVLAAGCSGGQVVVWRLA